MRIEVELIAFIQKYAPDGKNVFDMDLPEGATVTTVVEKLGIPKTEPRLTLINGAHTTDDNELHDGDTLVLLTPVEGG
jgi:molybdopterin converting factor small subunit